ncbi:hypothetical protein BU26DRAFT_583022 [Trematosphaeria pertusa]|uniref:Uncharacterized protein n=1 Tax=Trematosphaeria pertusa TaxID=390896 RepID=A0A6A6IVG4_9PLEO|nr:uncharacterized protein BU26DRAFT_583022 [Trematosphaeria pertusa]KAF2254419.1 hypothetical protein BU26DRAFT_583022 [Trematosphaeria pertusa]
MIMGPLIFWATLSPCNCCSTLGDMFDASRFTTYAGMPGRARKHGSYDLTHLRAVVSNAFGLVRRIAYLVLAFETSFGYYDAQLSVLESFDRYLYVDWNTVSAVGFGFK